LTCLEDPSADNVLVAALNVLDETGAWVEFYNEGVSAGCRCRAWESSINVESMIKYFESM
jgi:hypothetical protein